MSTLLSPPVKVTAGQDPVTVATAPLNGGVSVPCRAVVIQAQNANTVTIAIGDADNQVIELLPGDSVTIPIHNINQLYHTALAVGTSQLNWLAVL